MQKFCCDFYDIIVELYKNIHIPSVDGCKTPRLHCIKLAINCFGYRGLKLNHLFGFRMHLMFVILELHLQVMTKAFQF